jgi:hypothetical protein
MEAEEAMGDSPVFQKRFPDLEEFGDPSSSGVAIKGLKHVIDHPEDVLTTLGFTEIIAFCRVAHLFDSHFSSCNERLKEVEIISATGLYHRH